MSHTLTKITLPAVDGGEERDLTIIGTAHISEESVKEVGSFIRENKPECVCIELDEGRLSSMENKEKWESLDIIKVLKEKKGFLEIAGVQTVIASLICIILGLLVGYVVLLCINPSEAWSAMTAILKNFLYFPRPEVALEYFGSTLAKTAPLLMCTLSILFAYKVGLFNIGASGQYAVGAGLALYLAIAYQMPWYVCMIAAMIGGGILGGIVGILKAYLNVNEVIAGIMLNWISLYSVNMLLTNVKESSTTYTMALKTNAPGALIPSLGLDKLFSNNRYVTIAIPLAVIIATQD